MWRGGGPRGAVTCGAVKNEPLSFFTRFWFAWVCLVRVFFDGTYAARVWRLDSAGSGDGAKALSEGLPRADADALAEAEPAAPSAGQDGQSDAERLPASSAETSAASSKAADVPPETPDAPLAAKPSAEAPAAKPLAEAPAAEKSQGEPPSRAAPVSALQLLGLLQRDGRLIDFLEQDIAAFSDADVGAAARVVHEGCRRALHAHAKIAPVRVEPENEPIEVSDGFRPAEIKLSGDVRGSAPYRGTLRHRGWKVTSLELPIPLADHDPSIVAPAEVEL